MDDKTSSKLFGNIVEGLMPKHPKPPEDLGWQLISASSTALSEWQQNHFRGAVRDLEYLFTSGIISTADFLVSLGRAINNLPPPEYFMVHGDVKYKVLQWDSRSHMVTVNTSSTSSEITELAQILKAELTLEVECADVTKLYNLPSVGDVQFVSADGADLTKVTGLVRSILKVDENRVRIEVEGLS